MDKALNGDRQIVTSNRQRFEDVYDAIATAFDFHEIPLTEGLLGITIPAAIFECAVVSEWIPNPFDPANPPTEPCALGNHTVEQRHAEQFMDLLQDRISFWLEQLESDQENLWEMRVNVGTPKLPDPHQDTPAILLERYRQERDETNYVRLATAAERKSKKNQSLEAILAAIYRIEGGTNVAKTTLECVAEAMSTEKRRIDWRELRWPRPPRKRPGRKSTNKK